MLREITPDEALLIAWSGRSVLAVNMEDPQETDWIYFKESIRNCRFLIDDEAPEEVLPEAPAKPRRKRRTQEEIEAAVMKAWNRGERSIEQIMEMTGCSYKQVREYIPETKEG